MYKGLLMSSTVRKNFVFSQEIASHLEEMAKDSHQSMTSFVEEMIEQKYGSKMVEKRVTAFNKFAGSANGLFTDSSIQSIKANKDD